MSTGKWGGYKVGREMSGVSQVSAIAVSVPTDIDMTCVVDVHNHIFDGVLVNETRLYPIDIPAQNAFRPLHELNLPTIIYGEMKYYSLIGTQYGYLNGRVLPVQAIPVRVAQVTPNLMGPLHPGSGRGFSARPNDPQYRPDGNHVDTLSLL